MPDHYWLIISNSSTIATRFRLHFSAGKFKAFNRSIHGFLHILWLSAAINQ